MIGLFYSRYSRSRRNSLDWSYSIVLRRSFFDRTICRCALSGSNSDARQQKRLHRRYVGHGRRQPPPPKVAEHRNQSFTSLDWNTSGDNEPLDHLTVSANQRSNLIFGANTGVGKTIVSAGLIRAAILEGNLTKARHLVRYIKPLQTGGRTDDQDFVERYATIDTDSATIVTNLQLETLFSWNVPASPHLASRVEDLPVRDDQVLTALRRALQPTGWQNDTDPDTTTPYTTETIIVETAGGVLSPASASPLHQSPKHAFVSSSLSSSATTNSTLQNHHWGWSTQADLYQALVGQLPVVLVGDGRLGGISATLSALESLILRGYDIAAVVIIDNPTDDSGPNVNVAALREYANRPFRLRAGNGESLLPNPEQSIVSLPAIPINPRESLDEWYNRDQVKEQFDRLHQYLHQMWQGQVEDLHNLRTAGRNVVWWPFTQHGNVTNDHAVTLIDSASGDYFQVLVDEPFISSKGGDKTMCRGNEEPEIPLKRTLHRVPMFDACASWWTQGVGHGESSMALAAAAAAGRYGHVIFPNVVHAPAVALSQRLIGPTGPGSGWADRVFYTDDGSTAMEVAIKMGLKTYQKRVGVSDNEVADFDWAVCAQENCYHGDTLGAMDVAEPSIFNQGQHPWYEPKGLFLQPPSIGFRDGVLSIQFPEGFEVDSTISTEFASIVKVMDVDARKLSPRLLSTYKELIEMQWLVFEHSGVNRKIGAVVLEPILMGAGGMKFVDPLWQRALIDVAKSRSAPVVFDEVASGMYRLGIASCREIIKADPDIAAYAKLLTGGLLPLSATLASEEVFQTFLGDEKGQALLHGHSYTAHPVGCVSALHALDGYAAVDCAVPKFDEQQVSELSKETLVQQTFALGTVLAVTIQIKDGETGGYGGSSQTMPIVERLRANGIYARPLGNVIYLMVSPFTSQEECAKLTDVLHRTIQELAK